MHERISVNAICFPRAGAKELVQAWRALGCRRVSLVGRQVLEEGGDLRDALAANGLQVETITHNFVLGPLRPEPESWSSPRERLSRLIAEARDLGARSIYMLTGGRGSPDWEMAAQTFAQALAPCVTEAAAAGIALMLENAPPLYADLHLAHSLADAITLAEIAGIGVCIDLFGCWAEAGVQASIARATPRCGLIQVSDHVLGDRAYPCRAVPGDGAIPLERLIAGALEAGYAGAFDLELLGPRIDREGPQAAVARAADRLGELLVSLGA